MKGVVVELVGGVERVVVGDAAVGATAGMASGAVSRMTGVSIAVLERGGGVGATGGAGAAGGAG